MSTPPIVTTDFLYVRFIGDRTIDEKDFGKIQKDRVLEMKKWARRVKGVQEENKQLNLAIVASNNHYAGFGPGTANMFRKMVGLSELSWQYKMPEQQQQTDINNSYRTPKSYDKEQSKLTDFLE
jgi:uncharacterized protein YecE (DUF72 family)